MVRWSTHKNHDMNLTTVIYQEENKFSTKVQFFLKGEKGLSNKFQSSFLQGKIKVCWSEKEATIHIFFSFRPSLIILCWKEKILTSIKILFSSLSNWPLWRSVKLNIINHFFFRIFRPTKKIFWKVILL